MAEVLTRRRCHPLLERAAAAPAGRAALTLVADTALR
jgi:hypothetical protein